MADIRVNGGQMNVAATPANHQVVNNKPDIKVNNTPDVSKAAEKAEADRKEKLIEELLENVVSVSEDGDTVQVSDEGSDKLNAGIIETDDELLDNSTNTALSAPRQEFDIPIENKDVSSEIESDRLVDEAVISDELDEVTDDADESSYSPAITSYTGYTDTQLEQMYLKGDISKFDYDQEMEAREAQREETDNNSQTMNEQVMGTINGMERVSQDAEQIKLAFGSDSAETPDPMTRIEIMSTLQDLTK